MATTQLTASSISAKGFASFEGLRSTTNLKVSYFAPLKQNSRSFHGLVVKASTVVSPKYTSLKPLGDRVLVKIKTAEEKSVGGILLPMSAQSKPQGGEVVAVGEGHSIGKTTVEISIKNGTQVLYSKYAGTELEFDGSKHLILKEDDIVGILETDDIKDLQPLNDRVLIKVAEVEEKTTGGLFLSQAAKEKPSFGTVIAVGPGPLDEEGKRKALSVSPGGQMRQNMVTILDVAMPAPSLSDRAQHSFLGNLQPLIPDISEDVEDFHAVETMNIHGAVTSGNQRASINEVKDAVESAYDNSVTRPKFSHLSASTCPLPIPLPYPLIFGNMVGQHGELLQTPISGSSSRGSLEVHSIPMATRLRSSTAVLPFLERILGDLRRFGIERGALGAPLLQSWGFGKDEVEDMGEVLSKMVTTLKPYQYSSDSD